MRILTFNLWHGLSPKSPIAFEALEPVGRRQLREAKQLELLRELQPDICLFQEVNPSAQRAPNFASTLNMDVTIQPDLVGLKLFGFGLPYNLNSGLVTLARKSFGLKKLEGASLSRPGVKHVHEWGSWQLKEERFALFSEVLLPGWGRVLLINTHLHHGLESTPEFEQKLATTAQQMELSLKIVSEIHARLEQGCNRRMQEILELLRVLEKYENSFEAVILAGDLNASPESQVGIILQEAGFRDVWMEAHPADEESHGFTYDGTRNTANHFLQSRFPITLTVEDLSFSAKTKDALLELAREQEARPRRIDYIWMRSKALRLKVPSAHLAGRPDAEGFAVSDHFGVCAEIQVD